MAKRDLIDALMGSRLEWVHRAKEVDHQKGSKTRPH